MNTIKDIERDIHIYSRKGNFAINSKNANRLRKKLRKLGYDMYPAIFKVYTNFYAYPEAYRSYIYLKEDDKYKRVYLRHKISEYLKAKTNNIHITTNPFDGSTCLEIQKAKKEV